MNVYQDVNSRSKRAFSWKADGEGIRDKLFKSHLTVAIIGLGMLIVAFASTLFLRSETLSLVRQREPTVRASIQAIAGLERSLAALRGWEVQGEQAFKSDRAQAWDQEIMPAVDKLKVLSRGWEDVADKTRLDELIGLLEEIREEQWWIEEVAQTPGNVPAHHMLEQRLGPIAKAISTGISGLIDVERNLHDEPGNRDLLWRFAELQGLFVRAEFSLSDYVHSARPSLETDFRSNLQAMRKHVDALQARDAELKPDQQDILALVAAELSAFRELGEQVIHIRQSERWNVARHLMASEAVPRARAAGEILRDLSQSQMKRMQQQSDYVLTISDAALLFLLCLIAAMASAAWIVSRRGALRITQPLSALSEATQRLAAGHLMEDIPVTGDGEIASLTASFNAMRGSLQKSRSDLKLRNVELEQEIAERQKAEHALQRAYEELETRIQERTADLARANAELLSEVAERKQAEERFRLVVEGSPNALVLVNQTGKILLVNTQTEQYFGYSRDDLIGKQVEMLMPERFRDNHAGYLGAFFRDPQSRSMGAGRDLFAVRKDGVEFPVEIGLNPIQMGDEILVLSVILDITERKQAEKQLLFLSSATEQSPNAILITDAEGKIEYVNSRFTVLTGYSADELIGRNPRMLRSGTTAPEKYTHLWETIVSGGEWRGELQDKKKNGELYWVYETIAPIRNSQGAIAHFLAIQQDITLQKRAEEARKESAERFQHVADMTGEWIWEQDLSGHYVYCSAAVEDILGYAPEEIIGKTYTDLFTSEDREHWESEAPELTSTKDDSFSLINHYQHKDGHEVFTESTGIPIHDGSGRLVKWRGVDRDITARKRFEDAVRLRDRAIEAASVGIVITDANQSDDPAIYVNSALSRMTGYRREELLGQNMRMLQGHGSDPATISEIREAISNERPCEVIVRNYRKDGTPFWNALLLSPVRDDRKQLTHYIGVLSDVTRLREADEQRYELELAKQIQQSLLPQESLHVKNVSIAGSCLPALNVGGDYFDYFRTQDAIDMVIADVSGHSVGAALIMAETRSTLKRETSSVLADKMNGTIGAAAILRNLNELLYEDLSRAELFITAFYVKYHPGTGTLDYANAGHNCALLLRHDENSCVQLDADGLILGVKKDVIFEEKSVRLRAHDTLLLYTDGITEAENQQGDFFGVDRLCAAFTAHRAKSPRQMINGILDDLKAFRQNGSFNDDVSMVVLKIQ